MKHYLQYFIIAFAFFLFVVGVTNAVPTTGAATLVGSNNVTIGCAGTAGDWYVQYGQTDPGYYKTPNSSTGSSVTMRGGFFGSSLYLYTCCDSTGCGNTNSFTTGVVTPLPSSNIGAGYLNMTQNNYDIPMMAVHLADPYLWNPNVPLTIIFMLMFSPMFIGIWLRSRTVLVAMIFGFVVGSFILFAPLSPIGVSMPPEIISLAQAICYLAFAGTVLYIVHR